MENFNPVPVFPQMITCTTSTTGTAGTGAVSPDPGCFVDDSSPHERRDSVSPFSPSFPDLGDDVDDILCVNPLIQEGQERNKEATPALLAAEDDKGYVSSTHDQKEESPAESSPERQHDEQAPMRGQQVSFKKDLCPDLVKSKVEIPGHPRAEQKADQSGDKTVQTSKIVNSPRSSFWNEKEWEEKKRIYVASVTSHMAENRNMAQGSTSELQALMTHVNEQRSSDGTNWQHPSDLTSRNYQKRFGNETPKMTLSEWKAKNSAAGKRFSNVPKIFERSPYP